MVQTDDQGERSFLYWRDSAPVKQLLDDEATAAELFKTLESHAWLFLSGITLAVLSEVSRQRLMEFIARFRQQGGKVIFDSNYRPKLWLNRESTQAAYEAMYRQCDIALPTLEDEQLVFEGEGQDDIINRLKSWGVPEIVLKMGGSGCLVVYQDEEALVSANKVSVVDTTSAGDSFNAGYLAARMHRQSAFEAAFSGHRLASVVIQHSGAIIPSAAMPVMNFD